MGRRMVAVVVVLAVVLAGGGLAGYLWWRGEQTKDREATAVLTELARSLPGGHLESSGLTFSDPASATTADTLAASLQDVVVGANVGNVDRAGDRASATMHVAWQVGKGEARDVEVPVGATLTGGTWVIDPPAKGTYIHPDVKPDETVTVKRTWGTRGDILDRNGKPLMPLGTVYPVQLDPVRASAATAAKLETLVGEPSGSLVAKLKKAQDSGSKAPIPVITYRQSDFLARRTQLDALKGVIYPKTTQPLARTRTFGQPLLGSFGEVTAEIVKNSDGRYRAGDRAGLSGLQRQYDRVLAGQPGTSVVTSGGTVLFENDPVDGGDVKLTLDPQVQQAAEDALTGSGDTPSALVAVDVRSGDVLASANRPELGFDRALQGRFPPGSTMKVATTYALLGDKITTVGASVPCPPRTVVDGMVVRNYEGETLGDATFADDFHHSCNTAFVNLAQRLGDRDLTRAAGALGVGADWASALGVDQAFDGSIPVANGTTDKAAAAIGQARDEVSPAALAVMAASVARGSYIQPALVTSPEPPDVDRTPQKLDQAVVGQLRELMRGVVTEGTAPVLRSVPGGPVHAKTGTAEFGSGNPPKTRAWIIGWQGNVAFAVLVEEGKSGGSVAGPLAADFLTRLARG